MTDKELKKLSRLEILELLLEQTKENERLRQENEQLKKEFGEGTEADKLQKLSEQLNSALSYANMITNGLKGSSVKDLPLRTNSAAPPIRRCSVTEKPVQQPKFTQQQKNENENTQPAAVSEQVISDRKLYWQMMYFLSKNEKVLSELPPDIQKDVRERIRGILDARK